MVQKQEGKAGARTRTEDLLITNQLLYQLSYAGTERDDQCSTRKYQPRGS